MIIPKMMLQAKNAQNKRPVKTGPLFFAKLPSTCAVRKRLKKTLYFKVGNRCLCPKVPSKWAFPAHQGPIPLSRVYRFFQIKLSLPTPQGANLQNRIYQITKDKSSKIFHALFFPLFCFFSLFCFSA